MKLATIVADGRERLGALAGETVVDLNAAATLLPDGPPSLAPSLKALLTQGADGLARAADLLAAVEAEDEVGRAGVVFALDAVQLRAPVPDPQKILAIGLNYRDHCQEQGLPEPTVMTLFSKFPSAVIGPGDPIVLPPADVTRQVDYEAELAFMVGKPARDVPEAEAYDYIAGYLCCNDVSARDVQAGDGGKQWVHAKGFDTFAPLGPWLTTRDEIEDPHTLAIQSLLNGEVMQDSSTEHLVFRVPWLLAELSRSLTLLPGDIVTTGTPGGVGLHRDPPVFLAPGDTITVRIERLGALTNPVTAAG